MCKCLYADVRAYLFAFNFSVYLVFVAHTSYIIDDVAVICAFIAVVFVIELN